MASIWLLSNSCHYSSHVVQNDCVVARYGVGVYHYFRDAAVTVRSAIVAPTALERYFVSPLSVARLAARAFGNCTLEDACYAI